MIWDKKRIESISIILLSLLSIVLVFIAIKLDTDINFLQNQIHNLILQIASLENQLLLLQEQLEEALKKSTVPVSLPSNGWSKTTIVKFICIGCLLTTCIGTKFFFANTPYLLSYTPQSWNYNIISYFYPVVWTKDSLPRVFKDNMNNYFQLVVDTNLDKFVLDAQLAGTTTPITIGQFIQWALGLS